MEEIALGRIDIGDPDHAAETMDGVHRRIDDAAASGIERVTFDVAFAAPFGYAFLEAERLRARERGVELALSRPASALHPRPFHDVMGFANAPAGSATTIPLRRFENGDGPAALAFLARDWGGKARSLSSVAVDYVVEAIGEFFENGFTHARSSVGVVSCGQYFPKNGELHLGIVDLGIGIPASVAESAGRREEDIDAPRALRWAFEEGHSSRATSRGLGLAIVKDFVAATEASLHVFSGGAYATLRGARWTARSLPASVPGTIYELQLPTAKVRLPDVDEN